MNNPAIGVRQQRELFCQRDIFSKGGRARKHLSISGILIMVFGAMDFIAAGIVFILFVGAGFSGNVATERSEIFILPGIFGVVIAGIVLITSLPGIAAGYGIIKFRPG